MNETKKFVTIFTDCLIQMQKCAEAMTQISSPVKQFMIEPMARKKLLYVLESNLDEVYPGNNVEKTKLVGIELLAEGETGRFAYDLHDMAIEERVFYDIESRIDTSEIQDFLFQVKKLFNFATISDRLLFEVGFKYGFLCSYIKQKRP